MTHRIFEKDGYEPRWRGIFDDRGRLMVAICHNMDLATPGKTPTTPLPREILALGIRLGVK